MFRLIKSYSTEKSCVVLLKNRHSDRRTSTSLAATVVPPFRRAGSHLPSHGNNKLRTEKTRVVVSHGKLIPISIQVPPLLVRGGRCSPASSCDKTRWRNPVYPAHDIDDPP